MEFKFDFSNVFVQYGILGLIIWNISERVIHWFGYHQSKQQQREEQTYILLTLAYCGAFYFSLLDAVALKWTWIGNEYKLIQIIGLIGITIGMLIRIVSRLSLKHNFSEHVQTDEKHKLVTSGIYAYVRHPAYTGYICLLFAFPLCFGSIAGIACTVFIGVPAVYVRIQVEEQALVKWFGEEYVQYQSKTKRLFP